MQRKEKQFAAIFDYLFLTVILATVISIFFGLEFSAICELIGLLIMIAFSLLDKKFGKKLTDHRVTHFLINVMCLIFVIVVFAFNFTILNLELRAIFISLLLTFLTALGIDIFMAKDNYYDKRFCNLINLLKIFVMICLVPYFYGLTDMLFSLLILCSETIAILMTICACFTISDDSKDESNYDTNGGISAEIEKLKSLDDKNKN